MTPARYRFFTIARYVFVIAGFGNASIGVMVALDGIPLLAAWSALAVVGCFCGFSLAGLFRDHPIELPGKETEK